MGHGPAKNQSTSDQFDAFSVQANRQGSITQLAVETFDAEYPKAVITSIDSALWDALETARAGRFSVATLAPVQPWDTSKDEFARWFLAAQSLVAQTKIEHTPDLTITIGTATPKAWTPPKQTAALGHGAADLNGKFDSEVWLQDASAVPFMIRVAKNAVPAGSINMKFLGLAVDVAAQAIPAVLFDAKARVGADRPYQVDPTHPVALPKPEHSSWPGGHAFWCGALTELLYEPLARKAADPKALKDKLRKGALRIARNRVRAGLHWTEDTVDGIAQGEFVMKQWINLSAATAQNGQKTDSYPGDAGDLWRLISQV